jgi:hypothetical protein
MTPRKKVGTSGNVEGFDQLRISSVDALTDSELFKALLTGAKSPGLEEKLMPWLLPYLVGEVAATNE